MSIQWLLHFLSESAYLLLVFAVMLFISIKWGRQTITNIIFGLYLALLLVKEFPYHEQLLTVTNAPGGKAFFQIALFALFVAIATRLFAHVLPREYNEKPFESFLQKVLLAMAATTLVMIFSYHALPVTEYITPGTPISFLFGNEHTFFYWLLVPLIILFVV